MIEIIQYIVLGIIQGFTEPIPVSSSGHVMILNNLLNTNIDIGLLAVLTNFGSLIAIIVLYWDRIKTLFLDFFNYLKNDDPSSKENLGTVFYLLLLLFLRGLWDLLLLNLDFLMF